MSILVEHDYIGSSSEVPPMENSDKSFSSGGLNLKATELRLGLPGSESPESKNGISQLSIGLSDNNNYSSSNSKSLMSGAKRGFSVAIHGGSGNWVFSGGAGSESDFSPAAANVGKMITGSGSGSDSGSVQDGLAQFPKPVAQVAGVGHGVPAASKAHVVGWPPIRSFRKNTMASNPPKNDDDAEAKLGSECLYIKVSMDGAPYLRKVDLKTYASYMELSSALEKMFSCFTIGQCSSNVATSHHGLSESRLMDLLHGSEYVLTYEDKDGDWMLVGDVPWKMFTETCRRLRIMKSSDAVGLAPRAMEKSKSCN